MTRNAPTFLDELHDPEVGVLDAAALRRFGGPVLLTVGDRSPAPMRQPVAALASALPSAAVVTLDGAGHVPHLTHFREYATLLNRFMRGALP
jgi:pimeloyl-ACP methyl ester carboxylesterase